MKKWLVLAVLLAASTTGFAQNVENFEVGPYEVEYKDVRHYRSRLRKGVDLYKFYGLKKDTTIVFSEKPKDPICHAWQIGAELMTRIWGYGFGATEVQFNGIYKYQISPNFYLNGGLSMAFQVNKCNNIPESGIGGVKANIFEIGIPLSIEYSNIKKESCAPFILFALSPVYSTTLSQKEEVTERDLGGSSAFRLDPRVEFGTYFPIGGQLCRIGLFFKTGISLTESNPDGLDLDYGRRTSRVGVGGNISIVF